MNRHLMIVLWITVGDYRLSTSLMEIAHRHPELTAVSYSLHAQRLYQKVRTDDSPYKTRDPASFDQDLRERICREVIRSGFLQSLHLVPIDTEKIRRNRHKRRYWTFFQYIYTKVESDSSDSTFVYANSFRPLSTLIGRHEHWLEEYVFVCPVQHSLTFDMDLLYVTKEYNVNTSSFGSGDGVYRPGRFIIGNFLPAIPGGSDFDSVILAEEPAKVYTASEEGFDVEFYYLRIRRYAKPAESNQMDPLCKLISDNESDPDNQHHRFCVAVSASSHFTGKIGYIRRTEVEPCSIEKISFKTAAGMSAEVKGKLFYERMARCNFVYAEPPKILGFFYISRAYSSNKVLVYSSDPTDSQIYVDNLSTNISILDELNSFDFVEQ